MTTGDGRAGGERVIGLVRSVLGDDPPVRIRTWDGHAIGDPQAPGEIVVRAPDALRRIVTAPGELGFARAYVAGDLDVEGDLWAVLRLGEQLPVVRLTPRQWLLAARSVGPAALRRPAPPPEEVRLHGRRHTRRRDAAAVSHHYDVPERFYELVLGPSMTYSCALFHDPDGGLEQAQAAKNELVCRKLGLRPGMRLLDVGCGWGALAVHAARHHGVRVVAVTLAPGQADSARRRVAAEGLADRVEVRHADYREIDDGPFDAIASVGMFEHVGRAAMRTYFERVHALVAPGGRFLNHAIARPAGQRPSLGRNTFIHRYVFPDGELHEVGDVVSGIQQAGFEVRHVESLREHYALTLRRWVANLEGSWDQAVAIAGEGRARVWRLYMAASAVNFEAGRLQIHQVLGVRPRAGVSGLPLRPDFSVRPGPEVRDRTAAS